MAILDSLLRFSDGEQTITAAGASTDTVDLGGNQVDLGTGETLYLVVNLSFTGGTSPTVTADLQQDDDNTAANFANVSGAGFGALSAGQHKIKLPVANVNQRYLRMNYTSLTGSPTNAKIESFITKNIDQYTAYRSGYTVST